MAELAEPRETRKVMLRGLESRFNSVSLRVTHDVSVTSQTVVGSRSSEYHSERRMKHDGFIAG